MDQKADEEGIVVVYPQALGQPTSWFGVLFGKADQPASMLAIHGTDD